MAGRWPSGNSTSTTGPKTCRTLPDTVVDAVAVTSRPVRCFGRRSRVRRPSGHGVGAADDVEQLLGDALLAGAVVALPELSTHARRGVGRALHRHAARGHLARERG